jgi:hypothetical protein
MTKLLMLVTLLLSMNAMAAMTVVAPARSPSLGEMSDAQLVDESSRHLPIYGVIFPSSNV